MQEPVQLHWTISHRPVPTPVGNHCHWHLPQPGSAVVVVAAQVVVVLVVVVVVAMPHWVSAVSQSDVPV